MCCSILDLLRVLATNRKLQAISAELLTTAKDAVKAFNAANSPMPAYRLCQLASFKKLDLFPISEYGIGIVGMQALAGVVSSGALDHLTVCWRQTALFPCLETLHTHSPDQDVLFDVQYAGALPPLQPDRRCGPLSPCGCVGEGGAANSGDPQTGT